MIGAIHTSRFSVLSPPLPGYKGGIAWERLAVILASIFFFGSPAWSATVNFNVDSDQTIRFEKPFYRIASVLYPDHIGLGHQSATTNSAGRVRPAMEVQHVR